MTSPDPRQGQQFNNSGEPLPDIGLKWGKSPRNEPAAENDVASNKTSVPDNKPDWENYYSEEEKEKLRKQGINPALKAEMEDSRKKQKGHGFWGKMAQTALGGGVIK